MDRCIRGDAEDVGGLIVAVKYMGRGGCHGQFFYVFCVVWVAADVDFFIAQRWYVDVRPPFWRVLSTHKK